MSNRIGESRSCSAPGRCLATGVVALALAVSGAVAGVASANIAYDGSGYFMHEAHQRNLYFISSVDGPRWSAQTRDAQVNFDDTMNGVLGYKTASSHSYAKIGAEDDNYGATGWVGYAHFWGYHVGHGHVLLNQYYGTAQSDNYLQQVACQEIGHFSGLLHGSTPTDCMRNPIDGAYPTISYAHRDQLAAAWDAWGHPAFP